MDLSGLIKPCHFLFYNLIIFKDFILHFNILHNFIWLK
jgi:hypothetical protein